LLVNIFKHYSSSHRQLRIALECSWK